MNGINVATRVDTWSCVRPVVIICLVSVSGDRDVAGLMRLHARENLQTGPVACY